MMVMHSTWVAFADGGPWEESGEDVMARARAYVVGRQAMQRMVLAAEAEMERRLGIRSGTMQVLQVDDEWSRLVYDFVTSGRRQRPADALIAGITGSGKASAWWQMPAKSGIEFVPLHGAEIGRIRCGFVSDDELRDIADIPISWTPPVMPRRPRWWLIMRHPWPSLLGWWHGRRARRW